MTDKSQGSITDNSLPIHALAAPAEDSEARAMMAAVRALVRRFALSERADISCCGLTVAQAATLEALRVSGPLRLGELGRRLGITPSTLSRNLARLADAGLVERSADEVDARAARVVLTPAGAAAAEQVERQEQGFARAVLERLPEERRAAVVRGLRDLLTAVREATEACCPGAFDHLMTEFPRGGSRHEKETDDGKDCCQ